MLLRLVAGPEDHLDDLGDLGLSRLTHSIQQYKITSLMTLQSNEE